LKFVFVYSLKYMTERSTYLAEPPEKENTSNVVKNDPFAMMPLHLQEHLFYFFTKAPVAVALFYGPHFVIEIANDMMLAYWGKTKEQVLHKPLFETLPDMKALGLETAFEQVYKTGQRYVSSEIYIPVTEDDVATSTYIKIILDPLHGGDGQINGVTGTAQDVTDLVLARKKAEENEYIFRNMVERSPTATVILKGPDFVVDMANEAYLELVDRKAEGFVGRPLLEGLPEVESQGIGELLNNVYVTGVPYYGNEFPIYLVRNGKAEKRYVNFVYKPIFETGANINRIMVVATDVTSIVSAKHAVEESEKQFSNLVMQSPIAMAIFRGKDFIIEMANKQMLDVLWRKSEADIIGRGILEVFPELNDQKYPALLQTVFNTGIPHRENEAIAYVSGNDGMRKFYLDFEYAPLYENDGTISGLMVTVNNVTAQVEARLKTADAEQQMRLAIEAANAGTFEWDLVTLDFKCSLRLKKIFGFQDSFPVTHLDLVNAFHPEDKGIRDAEIKESLDKGSLAYEVRVVWPDQSIHWVKVYGKIVYSEERIPLRMHGTVMDITEEKKALMALKESGQRLNIAIQSAELGTWEVNLKTNAVDYSERYLEIVGFDKDAHPSHKALIARIHPQDLEHRNRAVAESLKTGIVDYETRLLSKNNTWTWAKAKGQVFYDENGLPERMLGTIMDITEAKMAYHTLQQSEERFKTIANTAPVMIWMSGNDKFSDFFNTSWLNFTGRLLDEEKGDGWLQNVHPEEIELCVETYRHSFALQQKFYIEYRLKRYDGQYRWIADNAIPRYDEQGNFIGFISACMDIHDQKELSTILQESEEKFRLLANFMPQFVWTGNEHGELNYFSQTVYDYTGLTPEQLQQKGWLQIVHPDDRENNVERWRHAISTGEDFIIEHRFKRYDGVYRWQLSRAKPQKDNKGNVQMWVGTSTDIEDIKELERQKDDFISMASHELKTPITSIKGYVQLLRKVAEKEGNPLFGASLLTIDKQVGRLTKLISELLDLTKINAGGLQLSKEVFDIGTLAQEVVKDIQYTSTTHKIELSFDEHLFVYADRDRISQVLINFLTNAIKYSPVATVVEVSITKAGNEIIVRVQDHGIGIAAADQPKIFDRFYRVQGKDELTFPGFGIGLFIAKDIVKKHQGKMWLDSVKDKGSAFYFSLPIHF